VDGQLELTGVGLVAIPIWLIALVVIGVILLVRRRRG
jgi:hypothetical protein